VTRWLIFWVICSSDMLAASLAWLAMMRRTLELT
jgi:hypothetical protein